MKNLDQVLYDEIASREESKHENTANMKILQTRTS